MYATTAPSTEVPPRPNMVVRAGVPSDNGFIAQSWVDTIRGADRLNRRIDPGLFNRYCYEGVAAILERAEVRVAGPPDDEVTIYGFAVLEPKLVHMVYVKKAWRRLGIGTKLLEGRRLEECAFSTPSRDMFDWIRHKYPVMGYRPFWMDYGQR